MSHDNSGPNPEWYLEFLRIEIPDRNEKYLFPCNRWLTGDEDRWVEVEVYPGTCNYIHVATEQFLSFYNKMYFLRQICCRAWLSRG